MSEFERRNISISDVVAAGELNGHSRHTVLVLEDGSRWKVYKDYINGSEDHYCFLRRVDGQIDNGRNQIARVPFRQAVFREVRVDSGYNQIIRLTGEEGSNCLVCLESEREIREH